MLSERAVVGEWKDGTQQFFSTAFTREWYERMQDLQGQSRAYDSFDAARFLALARKYVATYAVVPAEMGLPFDRIFENADFAVYALGGTTSSPTDRN